MVLFPTLSAKRSVIAVAGLAGALTLVGMPAVAAAQPAAQVAIADAGNSTLAAVPLQADSAPKPFVVANGSTPAAGHFIWESRSVRVGGSIAGSRLVEAAVVFTAYDGTGRVVARAARPGDNDYTPTLKNYGFTLNPSGGAIQKIVVDVWQKDEPGGHVHKRDSQAYFRPAGT